MPFRFQLVLMWSFVVSIMLLMVTCLRFLSVCIITGVRSVSLGWSPMNLSGGIVPQWIRARRRVLQCLSYQFPCALQLKQWGILKDVKCRLCEKYYRERNIPEPPDSVESVGHIQCYCPALQLPRIAIHHGICWELMFSIRKSSTELNDASEPRWHFPSDLSPKARNGACTRY